MDRSELKQRLEAAKVPESEYNLSGRGPVDNRYVLEKRGARWRIYYSERGLETQAAEFPTESEACEALLAKLVRKGAGSINRPLPLGSVVRLRTGTLKLMVVSRALRVPDASGKAYYYDYGAVAYPNGLISPDTSNSMQWKRSITGVIPTRTIFASWRASTSIWMPIRSWSAGNRLRWWIEASLRPTKYDKTVTT